MIRPFDPVEVCPPRPTDPALDGAQAHPKLPGHRPQRVARSNRFHHSAATSLATPFLVMSPSPVAAVSSHYTDLDVVAHEVTSRLWHLAHQPSHRPGVLPGAISFQLPVTCENPTCSDAECARQPRPRSPAMAGGEAEPF